MCIVRWPEFPCNWIPETVKFCRSILDVCWICLLSRLVYKNTLQFLKKYNSATFKLENLGITVSKYSHLWEPFPSIPSPSSCHFCNIVQLRTMWNKKCSEMLILILSSSKGQCSFHLIPFLWVWTLTLLCSWAIQLYKCISLAIKI